MQHLSAGSAGDVGAVVHSYQRAMPTCGVGENLQRRQLVARLQRTQLVLTRRALVAKLDDVPPAGQGGVDELGQITAIAARVGTQI